MPRKREYIHCPYNGLCDLCRLDDCYAQPAEILEFYSREEQETRRRFGRQKLDKVIPFGKIEKKRNGTDEGTT